MPAARGALPVSLSLLRIVSQGLIGATAAPDPVNAVRSMLAIQGQQVSAIPHAIIVRTPGADAAHVRRAFDEGDLVRSWPMRGTVHVSAAEDHHWLRSALAHRYASSLRPTHEGGLDVATIDRAGELALDLIASEGPVTRTRLIDLWQKAGLFGSFEVRTTGSPMSDAFNASWPRRRLLFMLHVLGVLAQGPTGSNEHLVIDASTLPDETRGPALGQRVGKGEAGHEVALVEIARRYASGHGPVAVADLARWAGLPVGECAKALEGALEAGSVDGRAPIARFRLTAEGDALEPYEAPLSPRERTASAFYMSADAPDLVADHIDEARRTIFLGMFDEMHVGYKDRTCLADERAENLICPSKNGMFRAFVVDRGRVVAIRKGDEFEWVEDKTPRRLDRDAVREVARVKALLKA